MRNSNDLEARAALLIAELMAAAARTAPKGRGLDNIETFLIDDKATREMIVKTMREIGGTENRQSFIRDSGNIEHSPAILLIGVRSAPAGLNCGFCGHKTCESLRSAGGVCAFNSIDLGIAAGSAASVASAHHADNRLMYSIGRAAIDRKLFSDSVVQALGIPLSITGKSPYFDRK